jgi:hypothetical protein
VTTRAQPRDDIICAFGLPGARLWSIPDVPGDDLGEDGDAA